MRRAIITNKAHLPAKIQVVEGLMFCEAKTCNPESLAMLMAWCRRMHELLNLFDVGVECMRGSRHTGNGLVPVIQIEAIKPDELLN